MYLLLHDSIGAAVATRASAGSVILEERRQQWEEIAKTLKNDEQILYKAIIDEGIVNQSALVEKTGLPKSNISRALYGLESSGLIERRRPRDGKCGIAQMRPYSLRFFGFGISRERAARLRLEIKLGL